MQCAVSISPATGDKIASYPFHGPEKCEEILAQAAEGQLAWAALQIAERAQYIARVGVILRKDACSLGQLISLEMGKPVVAARGEIEKCAALCEWYAAHAEILLADEIADVGGDGEAVIAYRPLGVVLGVMPWNFPFWQVLRAAIPIMVAGNGFILKHADNVQGCAAALERAIAEANLPTGLFSVVNVTRDAIPAMLADRRIAAVTATAGVGAGSAIAAEAGRNLKKSVLELGGSDPFIILADADLDRAVQAAVQGRFQNCGQVCIAAKRLIVERPIADAFVARFVAATKRLQLGDPLDEDTEVGPMARVRLRTELHDQIERSVGLGATLLLGGRIPDGPGAYYPPTILANVTPDMPVFREETFGPVAAISIAENAEHAIALANDSDFGLSGALWCGDAERALRLARQIETGGIFVNGVAASDPRVPIGGVKQSGYGRELSHFGLREFTNAQLVWARD
ncbi:succinate-semialdehyde dehydrogenase [Sphingopyxis lindanitolerans]|uniref:Succinate-semialdehyde dehydrogenase n=1 Tax=Sphingopyxis lindanitolerans TaxID=2054227 RepID=A0A2S8B453_9SPHN|nr:succinate-semialdehyde dehydrogenase [Sphingopyxis lindanitolerans]